MMNEMLTLLLVWMVGMLLGVIFFGGLWWTVRKSVSSERPALWVFGSLLLRMGITLTGFYVVSDGQWQRLLLCLSGFIMARLVVTWRTRLALENPTRTAPEGHHAP
jgi:F1F0 ATPase subunit 2